MGSEKGEQADDREVSELRRQLDIAEAELRAWRNDWSSYLNGLDRDRSRYLDLLGVLQAPEDPADVPEKDNSSNIPQHIRVMQYVRDKLLSISPELYKFQRRLRKLSDGGADIVWNASDPLVPPNSGPAVLPPVRISGRTVEIANLFKDRFKREIILGLVTSILAHVQQYGRVRVFYLLNFYAGGGAEFVTWNYARVASREAGVIVILLTDRGPRIPPLDLPNNAVVLDMTDDNRLDEFDRTSMVRLLVNTANPDILHIVNSEAGWHVLQDFGRDKISARSVFASVFALQYDGSGQPVGYAARYLPRNLTSLNGLLSDNSEFIEHGLIEIGLTADERCISVPTPCRLEFEVTHEDACRRMTGLTAAEGRASGRMLVIWAGRLDTEKRIDLLCEIASLATDWLDFRVFGSPVVSSHDWNAKLEALPNVNLMGSYSSPCEWFDPKDGAGAFLFTSVWEGMPNTVIEAAWIGLPMVAVDVGGVGNLVDSDTGWLIPRHAAAHVYIEALREIFREPNTARARTSRLLERVRDRHTKARFQDIVKAAYQRLGGLGNG